MTFDEPLGEGLSLEQLEALVIVAELGSYARAAEKLALTPSSISQRVFTLEEKLRIQLFDRRSRPLVLTSVGAVLLRQARRVLAEVGQLKTIARELANGLEDRICLAVDALFPPEMLASALRAFSQRYPSVDLVLISGRGERVVAAVVDGRADLGLGVEPGGGGSILCRPSIDVHLVSVVAASHPLAHWPGSIPDAVLAEHVHLDLLPTGADPSMEMAFDGPRRWLIAEPHRQRTLLRAGMGWAQVPTFEVEEDLTMGRLVQIQVARLAGTAPIGLAVIHARDGGLGPAARWLVERFASGH